MATYNFPKDQVATVPLVYKDVDGNIVGVPAGASVTSSDTTILTASTADGSSIILTPVAPGTSTISVSVGDVSATLDVTVDDVVTPPALGSIEFDTANAVLTPATPAPTV